MPNNTNSNTWMQAAAGAATSGLAIGIQRAGAKYDRKQLLKTQEGLTEIQKQAEKEMIGYQNAMDIEMLKNTPLANMQGLKAAGLNPALMYGIGGEGGGTVGHSGPPISGGSAPYIDTTSKGLELGLQIMMQKAQIDNINADTKVKEETVTKTGAETKSITQGIENQKAAETLIRVQTEIQQVAASVARQTINDQMKAIEAAAQKATTEVTKLQLENQLSLTQMNDKISLLKAEAVGQLLKNQLTIAETGKTQVETGAIPVQLLQKTEELAQKWEQLSQSQQTIELDALMKSLEQEKGYQWNIGGKPVNYKYSTDIKEAVKRILDKK